MTNDSQQHNTIKNVLEKIENNELTIKSKNYFRLKFAVLILVLVAMGIVTIFLSSFILFSLGASGRASLIGFGPSGLMVFLLLFPWKLTVVEIFLVLLLEYMLRSFKFGYKVPAFYLLTGVVVLAILSSLIVNLTPLHTLLLEQADRHHLPPPFGDLYENTRMPPPQSYGIYRGTIVAADENILIVNIDNPRGMGTTTTVMVVLPASQKNNGATIGDHIFIRGAMISGQIQAQGIREAGNPLPPPQ